MSLSPNLTQVAPTPLWAALAADCEAQFPARKAWAVLQTCYSDASLSLMATLPDVMVVRPDVAPELRSGVTAVTYHRARALFEEVNRGLMVSPLTLASLASGGSCADAGELTRLTGPIGRRLVTWGAESGPEHTAVVAQLMLDAIAVALRTRSATARRW